MILDHMNLRILRGDRIGIVGKNGSGKTSFLKMIVRELEPDMGRVKIAKEIAYSYFDQKRKDLRLDRSIHQNLCPHGSDYLNVMGKTRHICGYLKDFLFDPKMVSQPVATLSGGQKNRLMLAKILANPGSLLILDEPTNDLDMDTLDMLEEILANYTGTLLVVSHDRDFLDQTVTKILAFEGEGKIFANIGGYHDYIEARNKRLGIEPPKGKEKASSKSGLKSGPKSGKSKDASAQDDEGLEAGKTSEAKGSPRPLSYKLQYELDNLPAKIDALERELAEIEQDLADPALYERDAEAFRRLSTRLLAATQERETAEHRWLELMEMAEQ